MISKVAKMLCLQVCSSILTVSCNMGNVQGIYVNNSPMNTDTLKLEKTVYHQSIYNKNNLLIYKGSGKWKNVDGYIKLDNFLINDNNVSEEFSYTEKHLMRASFPINSGIGNTEFIINSDTDIKYVKVK